MANRKLPVKRVCLWLLCVLLVALAGCRFAPVGLTEPELPEGTLQTSQDLGQGTDTQEDTTLPPDAQEVQTTDGTEEVSADPVETTQTPTQLPSAETTVPDKSPLPSDPPPAPSDPEETGDTTQQDTTGETDGMGNEQVPANTETGWGPIH